MSAPIHLHRHDPNWRFATNGSPRGYIQPAELRELWFHTGSICNLSCPFCLEGSKPGDNRIEQVTLAEAEPLMTEALELGCRQFSFTGGEPFVNREFPALLRAALTRRPTLVLTNGTKPLRARWGELLALRDAPHPLRFRVSFDHPDAAAHDRFRGEGMFALAARSLRELHQAGFGVSIARQSRHGEDAVAVEAAYRRLFRDWGVPEDTVIVAFPDFLPPGTHPDGVPEITENCLRQYVTAEQRASYMCSFSKMVVKRGGRIGIYACTLVDDDPQYDLGPDLRTAMRAAVMLRHHRCFLCFTTGASCSETGKC